MLIEKKAAQNDIVTFRIISGEEIVGKLVSHNLETGVTKINKPVIIAMQMVNAQQASLGFMPFLAAADDNFTVVFPAHSFVTDVIKAREDVAKGYINATSSIAVPSAQQSGLILGG